MFPISSYFPAFFGVMNDETWLEIVSEEMKECCRGNMIFFEEERLR